MNIALLKNTAWGALGEGVVRVAKIAQVILIAKLLGAEDLGRFSYGLSLVGLFAVFFDFGILSVAVKALVQDSSSSALRLFCRFKFITSSIGLALLGLTAMFSKVSASDAWIAFGLGVFLALNDISTFVVVVYRARSEFWRETLFRSSTSILQLMFCFIALIVSPRLESVVVVLIGTALFGMLPLLKEWSQQPAVHDGPSGWKCIENVFCRCVPLAGSILAGSIYMNFDTVFMANYVSMEQVGWYGVAVKAIFGLMIMPLHYLLTATFPIYASGIIDVQQVASVHERWLRGFVLSSTAGALLSLLTAIFSQPLLFILFGANFVAVEPVLVVFTLIGFMFYIYTPLSQLLLLQGRQKLTFYIQAVATVINIVLVLLFVPMWGIWGAVCAAFVTHMTIALAHGVVIFRSQIFTDSRPIIFMMARLILGLFIAIALMYFQSCGLIFSKLLAIAAFVILTYRECIALIRYFKNPLKNIVSDRLKI